MLFRGSKKRGTSLEERRSEIRAKGTPIRAVVTNVSVTRSGYIVMAVWEDSWLGTQHVYKSDVLKQQPLAYIGGEVIVYVDETNATGDYYVAC